MTIWSLFLSKVSNRDFFEKMANIGPYLVPILTKSPYISKSLTDKNLHSKYLSQGMKTYFL